MVATAHSSTVAVPGAGPVVGQLAWFEGKRQLRSPITWFSFVVSCLLAWTLMETLTASLPYLSTALVGACVPLAVSACLLSSTAAARDREHGAGESTRPHPTTIDRRAAGIFLSFWAPVLASLAVIAVGLVNAFSGNVAGSLSFAELAVGPMLVVLGQGLGTVLGRWVGHPVAAPLVLLVIVALFLIEDFLPGSRVVNGASTLLPWRRSYTDWTQGEGRMPLFHLVYLVGLIGVVASAASRKWLVLAASTMVAIASAVTLFGAPTSGEAIAASVDEWAAQQERVCKEIDGIRYCAYEGYENWIEDWAATVSLADGVTLGPLQPTEVVQDVNHWQGAGLGLVMVGGRRTDPESPLAHGVIGQIVPRELDLPASFDEAAAMNTALPACMAGLRPVFISGQARGVAVVVLSELAAPSPFLMPSWLHEGVWTFGHVEISVDEYRLAMEILERPRDEILDVLHSEWVAVVDPNTSSATLASWFGMEPPEVASAEASFEGMECECTGDGGMICTSPGREG